MDTPVAMAVFTKPLEYTAGVKRGFIVRSTDAQGTSWGEPFEDAQGNPIVPGTPGGPNDRVFLGIKNNVWKFQRDPKKQDVGNLDWKGHWKDAKQEKRRIVSFHGPTQRYWNTGSFVYESSPKHHEIYSDGKVIGIAPKPVLAACIAFGTANDYGIEEENVEHLIAICKDGEFDVVYATTIIEHLNGDSIEEEDRATYMSSPNQGRPGGWRELGRGNGAKGSYPTVVPETPWFFDLRGLTARVMRRVPITHVLNTTETGILEDVTFRELEVNIVLDGASSRATFQVLDPDSAFQTPFGYQVWKYWETIERHRTLYVQPAIGSQDGFEHDWQEDMIQVRAYMTGDTKACVDYDPVRDHWIYGWFTGQMYRGCEQYWTEGVDDPGHPNPNTGSHTGPLPKPSPYVPVQGDHYESHWVGMMEWINLVITRDNMTPVAEFADIALLWGRTGDLSVMNGGEFDSDNPYLAFWDSYDTWIHYCDIREGLVCGYVYFNNATIDVDGMGLWTVTEQDIEWAGIADPTPISEPGKPEDQPTEESDRNVMLMRHDGLMFVAASPISWTREEMEGWEVEISNTFSTYNYSYTRCDDNEDESKWTPDWRTYYREWMDEQRNPKWLKSTIKDMLFTKEKCDIQGVFGSTEKKEHLVSMIYFNLTEKAIIGEATGFTTEVHIPALEGGVLIGKDPLVLLDGGDRTPSGGVM